MRILMVCLGNICRSPIAEGVLRHKANALGLNWIIASAGTESYHIGEAPHPLSQKICQEHGIDISKQRAQKFVPSDLEKYDKIYAMAEDILDEIFEIGGMNGKYEKVDLFLNALNPGKNESVPDPYFKPESAYSNVFALIDACCDAIIHPYINPN